ncbi:MAG TPA: hypothetical protein VF138_04100 [Caulobacteraceae bacterium]
MRIALIAAALVAAAGPAAAQPAVLVKSKPIHGTVPDLFAELPGGLQRWIREEADRQVAAPTKLYDLEYSLLEHHEEDVQRFAKKQHFGYDETKVMLMHQVISKAASKMDRDVHDYRRELEKAGKPEAGDPGLEDLLLRKTMLAAEIEELRPRMTPNASLLARGSSDLANMGARGK